MGLSTGCRVNGFGAKVGRLPAILLIFLAGLLLTGCYSIREEVIPASLGEVIPFLSEQADLEGGDKIYFSRSTLNNDYRFRQVYGGDGAEKLGTFRAMRVKGNIYAVQARYDDESGYILLFYAITADRFDEVDVASVDDLSRLAAQHGVKYYSDKEFGDEWFDGSPDRILAMLKGMGGVEFE